MEIPQFDPNEKPAMTPKPVDRSKEIAAFRLAEANERLGKEADRVNQAERARRAAEPREAAERAFERTVDASMERVAKAKSPEDLLAALDGLNVNVLDATQEHALVFRLNQMVPAREAGRPRTATEKKIIDKIFHGTSGNAIVIDGALADVYRRILDEDMGAARPVRTEVPVSRETGPVVPGVARLAVEKRTDPGLFDRIVRNARNALRF